MSTERIDLQFPLDFGRADSFNYVALKIRLPSSATRAVPLREAHGVPLPAQKLSGRERLVEFEGKARVEISISDRVGSGPHGHGRPLNLDLKFQIVVGDPVAPQADNNKTPLLWGGVALDASQVFISSFPKFDNLMRRCWPTRDLREIRKLKFEPSGFYLAGEMPPSLLFGEPRLWVLRVPQPRQTVDPLSGAPLAAPPRRVRTDRRWKLTSERFHDVPEAVNAADFVDSVNETFRSFSVNGRKIVDSIADRTDSGVSIEVERVDNNHIQWSTLGAGTRIVVGSLDAGETQFLPNILAGEIHRSGPHAEWHHHHTRYVDAETVEDAHQMSLRRPVTLELPQAEQDAEEDPGPDLNFPDAAVIGLSVPAVRTEASPEDARRETVQRAWMCVQQGWLGLDADEAEPDLKPDWRRRGEWE